MKAVPGESATRLGYRPALDGVRAVAILAVLAFHLSGDITAPVVRGGFLGVDIFFVLSGFLITTLLLEEQAVSGSISLGRFYARRALRLFPALFVVVTVWVAYALTLGPAAAVRHSLWETFAALTYWNDWLRSFVHWPDTGLTHTWSLSIEEQFYVLWPLVLIALVPLRRWRTLAAVTVAGALASAIWRASLWESDESVTRLYHALDTRADTLLVGCLLAVVLYTRGASALRSPIRWAAPAALVLVVAALTQSLMTSKLYYAGGFTVFAAAVAVLIAYAVIDDGSLLARLLRLGPLVWLGRISYGLYLWHWPILVMLRDHVDRTRYVAPLAFVLTLAAAALSHRFVESPFLRLKGRLSVPQADAAPTQPREAVDTGVPSPGA